MGKVNFYAIWSLREAPRQFIRNVNRMMYQVQMPLPLPKQLIVFGLGEWSSFSSDTAISVEVQLGPEVKSQIIGTLSPHSRCLIWQGVWTPELLAEAIHRGRRGVHAKVVLSISGQVKASFISSTPRVTRKRLVLNHSSNPSSTLLSSGESHNITQRSPPEGSMSCADLGKSKVETQDYTLPNVQGVWPLDKTPRRTVIGIKGCIWSSEELESPPDSRRISNPKKRKLCKMAAVDFETTAVKHVKSCRADRPSKRWSHAMCLSDPDTAVLIGGEADDQASCKDSMWKLEIDSDFWFPMNTSTSEVNPPSSRGHSATFDPESKVVYVYGGLKDGQRYSDIHVLDTITWKWKLVTAKGNIPSLAYHSANVYKRELYVFGGVLPSRCSDKVCSNALYIFNPEHGLWYQPIVEGDRPLPRFGHTTTLLSDKLIIFGGRKTAAYLNDLHILDLGFMEYSAVKYENMPPLARGFHAALPVSDNRVLISGGCSAIGVLQDLHLFNTDTNSWTSVVSPWLCSKPRAGHSLISLGCTKPSDQKNVRNRRHISPSQQCTILVFGGSDCSGKFYNDTIKCTVELPI